LLATQNTQNVNVAKKAASKGKTKLKSKTKPWLKRRPAGAQVE